MGLIKKKKTKVPKNTEALLGLWMIFEEHKLKVNYTPTANLMNGLSRQLCKKMTMEKINVMDLFMLDVKSNQMIKKYRKGLGLETPTNRVDIGDLKMIITALHEMGFDVVKREEKPNGAK